MLEFDAINKFNFISLHHTLNSIFMIILKYHQILKEWFLEALKIYNVCIHKYQGSNK